MAQGNEDLSSGMGGVLFTGFLILLLGMVLGALSLVSQEVQVLTREPNPEALEPGKIIYIKGNRGGRITWRGKEQAWKAGQLNTIILTESELNQWSENRLSATPAEAGEEEGGWFDILKMEIAAVNFRILEDGMQLATELSFPGLNANGTYVYQVKGHFQSTPEGVRFVPESSVLGQAPVGVIPMVGDWFYNFVMAQYTELEETDWLSESLNNLDSIEIKEDQLILRRKAAG